MYYPIHRARKRKGQGGQQPAEWATLHWWRVSYDHYIVAVSSSFDGNYIDHGGFVVNSNTWLLVLYIEHEHMSSEKRTSKRTLMNKTMGSLEVSFVALRSYSRTLYVPSGGG
jgi:hypothetical protein